MSSDKLDKIEERLGKVEVSLGRMEERISHMPTTTSMWKSMGGAALLVLAGVWALLTFVGPGLMKTAVKSVLLEAAVTGSQAK